MLLDTYYCFFPSFNIHIEPYRLSRWTSVFLLQRRAVHRWIMQTTGRHEAPKYGYKILTTSELLDIIGRAALFKWNWWDFSFCNQVVSLIRTPLPTDPSNDGNWRRDISCRSYLSNSLLQDNKLMSISTRAAGWRYSRERHGPASLDDQWWQRWTTWDLHISLKGVEKVRKIHKNQFNTCFFGCTNFVH